MTVFRIQLGPRSLDRPFVICA